MVNKMKEVCLEVVSNDFVNKDVYLMTLKGDLNKLECGSFINLKLDNLYLRRPFSIFDSKEDEVSILYKVVGEGTNLMKDIKPNTKINALVELGHGFTEFSKKPLLIAGSLGVAPFYYLVKEFNKLNIKPTLIYGDRTMDNFVMLDFFKEHTNLILVTDDGSSGYKGNPVNYLKENEIDYDYYYACGPNIMLKNLAMISKQGYLSLEARMGCGFGACMGCSIKTTKGYKRVCKEGPVFLASEVIYE